MNRTAFMFAAILLGSSGHAAEWRQLPTLPDREGFAGMLAGVSHGALVAAGGANFPGKKPWEGGKKVWYDTIYVLDQPRGQWRVAGRLPHAIGYGVSVAHQNSVVCVGGSDADRHYADMFRLIWKEGRIDTQPLPSFPSPVANACGAVVGDMLYIAGGQAKPDATETLNTAYRIDLAAAMPTWQRIDGCPGGGRMLAAAAAFDGAFWIVGGVDLVPSGGGDAVRRYLADAWRYDPDEGWKRVADLPTPVAAAPSPAPADANGFYILGGDDGSQVGLPPERHRGFSNRVLRYDLLAGRWLKAAAIPAPRVTAPLAAWKESFVILSGEARPGIRSPEVWSMTPGNQE